MLHHATITHPSTPSTHTPEVLDDRVRVQPLAGVGELEGGVGERGHVLGQDGRRVGPQLVAAVEAVERGVAVANHRGLVGQQRLLVGAAGRVGAQRKQQRADAARDEEREHLSRSVWRGVCV